MKVIQLLEITPEELSQLIAKEVVKQLNDKKEPESDLLTREETCDFLKINSSTLWDWTNKGKVQAYGIGNRRYYKKSEILESLIKLKK